MAASWRIDRSPAGYLRIAEACKDPAEPFAPSTSTHHKMDRGCVARHAGSSKNA